jgi:hypothetical protein
MLKLVKHIIIQFFPLIWAIIHEQTIFWKENNSWTQMHTKSFQLTTFHKLIKEDGF